MDLFTNLRHKSNIAYMVIAVLLIGIFFIFWSLIDKQEKVANIINTVGKQRMLSQRIVMLSETIYLKNRPEMIPQLETAITDMRRNHDFIKSIDSPRLQKILFGKRYQYDKHLERFLNEASHLLLHQDQHSLDYLLIISDHMLSTADTMVLVTVQEYNEMIEFDKKAVIFLILLFLFSLFFVYRHITLRSFDDASKIYNDLRLSEQKIFALTENTQSLIYMKDLSGHYRFVNASFMRLLDMTKENVVGKTDQELFESGVADALQISDNDLIRSKAPGFYTDKIKISDKVFYFATNKFLLFDQDNRPYQVCGVATDITKQILLNEELHEAQKYLTHAQKAAQIGAWSIDAVTRELYLSDNAIDMLQIKMSGDYLMLDDLLMHIIEPDMHRILNLFEHAIDFAIAFSTEFHMDQNNKLNVFKIIAEIEMHDGAVKKLHGTVQNTTDTALIREKMREYVEMIDDNVITSRTDQYGIITYVSKAFSDISGYSKEELIGKTHSIVRHQDMSKDLFKDLWKTITSGKVWIGEIKNLNKNGESYWVDAAITPNFDYKGNIIGYTAIRNDITDKKYIEQIAITDGLTNLYNRRHFNDIGQKELSRTLRNEKIFAFALLDIDNFKKYNDTYGHQKGDEVLFTVAESLKHCFQRGDDTVFRLGGEEFGIILSGKETSTILQSIERARFAIENIAIEHRENIPFNVVTASFGVVLIDKDASDETKNIDFLYKEADNELYRAKHSGRNQVCINDMQWYNS